jgi:hypothetical protein
MGPEYQRNSAGSLTEAPSLSVRLFIAAINLDSKSKGKGNNLKHSLSVDFESVLRTDVVITFPCRAERNDARPG